MDRIQQNEMMQDNYDCLKSKSRKCQRSFSLEIVPWLIMASFLCILGADLSVISVHAFTPTSHTMRSGWPGSLLPTLQIREDTTSSRRTNLFSAALSKQETIDEGESLVNDFIPDTMSLTQSMVFFSQYLFIYNKERKYKKQLIKGDKKRGILGKLRTKRVNDNEFSPRILERLKTEVEQEKAEKKTFSETLQSLDKSRKELSLLVGFDTKLLVTCFGFAGLAAFMNSVIPHYYGQAVTCLANAMTTTKQDMVKALTGLGIASVLCALLTGIRGALFWLAGT